jgi:hypothetical protein
MQSKIQGCLYIMLHMPCLMQEMHKRKLNICYKGAPTHPTQEIKHTPSFWWGHHQYIYTSSTFTPGTTFRANHSGSCKRVELRHGAKEWRICGWIRTAHERQLVRVTTASSGLRFGRSSTWWKAYQVYFQMGLESLSYLHRGGRNRRFESDCFSV